MASGPEPAAEQAALLREKVTLTISPGVLRDVDRVRAVTGRSAFFEIAAQFLVSYLDEVEKAREAKS